MLDVLAEKTRQLLVRFPLLLVLFGQPSHLIFQARALPGQLPYLLFQTRDLHFQARALPCQPPPLPGDLAALRSTSFWNTRELPWLPSEQEKVAFFDLLGFDRRRLPSHLYHGAKGNQTRYFALKLPIATDTKTATFAYVDPGRYTDTELRSWGAAHEWLWRALRLHGIEVRAVVIGADHKATIRAEAALKTWSSRAGKQSSQQADGPCRNDPNVKAEIQHIEGRADQCGHKDHSEVRRGRSNLRQVDRTERPSPVKRLIRTRY